MGWIYGGRLFRWVDRNRGAIAFERLVRFSAQFPELPWNLRINRLGSQAANPRDQAVDDNLVIQTHDRDIRNYPLNNFPTVLDPPATLGSKRILKRMIFRHMTLPIDRISATMLPDLGKKVLERPVVIRDIGG